MQNTDSVAFFDENGLPLDYGDNPPPYSALKPPTRSPTPPPSYASSDASCYTPPTQQGMNRAFHLCVVRLVYVVEQPFDHGFAIHVGGAIAISSVTARHLLPHIVATGEVTNIPVFSDRKGLDDWV